jgi:hypothetical protein
VYPLEHIHRGTITPITEPKISKELTPEIIILITISISLIGIVISLSDKEDKVN